MGLRTKGAISSFVQSGNFESLTLMGFEPATLGVTVGHLIHYTKFPCEKNFKQESFIAFDPVNIVMKI